MKVTIVCIVEGDGEVEAVPLLLRRLGQNMNPPVILEVPRPIRSNRHKIIKSGELERAVRLAAKRAGKCGAILVLLDSDDDCPGVLGPHLFQRAISERGDIPLSVALAKREYEGGSSRRQDRFGVKGASATHSSLLRIQRAFGEPRNG